MSMTYFSCQFIHPQLTQGDFTSLCWLVCNTTWDMIYRHLIFTYSKYYPTNNEIIEKIIPQKCPFGTIASKVLFRSPVVENMTKGFKVPPRVLSQHTICGEVPIKVPTIWLHKKPYRGHHIVTNRLFFILPCLLIFPKDSWFSLPS